MVHHQVGKSENVLVSNSIGFPSNSKWDSPSHCIAYDYSCTDWGSLWNHLAEVPFQDIFKLSASAAASQFCVEIEVRIGIYICIPHHKYQVKPHSSPWFSAAYAAAAAAAAIVHTNQFFVNINRINFLSWKESSDRLVILTKGFLKLPNLDVLKKCCTSQKLGSQEFGKLLIVFSTNVNLLYLLYVFCIL